MNKGYMLYQTVDKRGADYSLIMQNCPNCDRQLNWGAVSMSSGPRIGNASCICGIWSIWPEIGQVRILLYSQGKKIYEQVVNQKENQTNEQQITSE